MRRMEEGDAPLDQADVGAVIVTWNSASTIERCLAGLPEGLEIVVVDNGSSDDTRILVAHTRAVLLTPDRNLGFGKACNLGAARLGNKHILLLNPDAALSADGLHVLLDDMRRDARLGVVGPLIRDPEGRRELSWGEDPTLLIEWARKQAHVRSTEHSPSPSVVDWVTGGCCLIRREAWEAVGGFDERFFLYFEDLDLCRRIRQAGYYVRFDPRAEALHTRGVSSRQIGTLVERYYRSSQMLYYRLHRGALQQAGLRFYLFAKYALKAWRSSDYRHIVGAALWGDFSRERTKR